MYKWPERSLCCPDAFQKGFQAKVVFLSSSSLTLSLNSLRESSKTLHVAQANILLWGSNKQENQAEKVKQCINDFKFQGE